MERQEAQRYYGWVVVAVATLVVFAALGLARFGYTAVLPAMQTALGMDNTSAGLLASLNLAGYLAFSAAGGALAARFGPRAVISVGLTVAAAGMLLTGLARTFTALAVFRVLTGLGSGASNVPVMGLLSAWAVKEKRGLATGIAVAGSSVGLIVVGPLAPWTLASFPETGWRICWIAFGGIALAVAAAACALLRNRPADVGGRPLGAARDDPPHPAAAGSLEWSSVYRAGRVWHLGAIYMAFGFSYIIYMTFFSKQLMVRGGYDAAAAGRVFMLMGWFSLFCGVLWGSVSDALGRRTALVSVYIVQAAAFALFARATTHAGFLASAILFGISAWSIPAVMAALCGDLLSARMAPAALGFVTLFFGIGQAIGPGIAGAIADATGSFSPAFLLAAAVALAGGVGALLLRPASTALERPPS